MLRPVTCLDESAVATIASGGESDDRAVWLAHADSCERCRQVVVAAIRAARDLAVGSAPTDVPADVPSDAPPTRLAIGDVIGRYHITGVLGEGGMGVVYEARDPELDRLLAIKLLHDRGHTARLVREAKALALLAHPNVVAIFDVGEHAGCPLLIMELVRGGTLRTWLAESPRTSREIVGVFEQAARGLAAAHAANLVHRDFKPDNVLVGSDGRVRVTDFGLARETPDLGARRPSSDVLTQSGALLGTPAYMSPEQHRGEAGDAKSDQFNFAVSLYEAVYGARPFVGKTWEQIAVAVLEGDRAPPPPGARAPRWLRRLIDRGLADDPAARHDDMTRVANLLAAGLARRRKAVIVAGAVAAVAAIAVMGAQLARGRDVCGAQVALPWNAPAKQRVSDAFVAIARPYAQDAFRATAATLDDYSARWAVAHRATCEATEVRHEQSAELLDVKMGCLAARRAELGELVALLAHADAELVARAPTSAAQLSNIADCDRVDDARVRTPAAIRGRVQALEDVLAQARADEQTGKYREALERARPVLAEARQLGYRPLEAEALDVNAMLDDRTGDAHEADRLYDEGIQAAEAGGYDRLKAKLWSARIDVLGEELAKPTDALALEPQARASVERVHDDTLRARLDEAVGRAQERAGDFATSRARYQAAIDTFERQLGKDDLEVAKALERLDSVLIATGDYAQALANAKRVLAIRSTKLGPAHPLVGSSLENLANAQFLTGDVQGSLATMRDAVTITTAAYGPHHTATAHARNNYGTILERAGQFDDAVRELDAALAVRREVLGAEHPDVATTLMELGNVYYAERDLGRAERYYRDALALREKVLGPEHPDIELAAGNLGSALADNGDLDGADQLYRRALAIAEKTRGPDSPAVSVHLTNLAGLAVKRGKPADAVPLYQRALANDEKRLGKDHPALAVHLSGLGSAFVDLHRPREAVPLIERAIELWTHAGIEAERIAEARVTLADALLATGDRAHAREQVAVALATFERDPKHNASWIKYAKDWQHTNAR
jgi:tetratricopeptide (TPR) repeat protein/tRNA A-37 threonylcarbamoyl transferase component Bud32